MKSCYFIGHRETSAEIFEILQKEIERHITQYGVSSFIVGNYGGFDRLAVRALQEAKKRHSEIILSLLTPYHPAEHPVERPQDFDSIFYPPGMETVPRRLAIVRANRYMVDHVDYLIACACYPGGNARELVTYARRREEKGKIVITNIR